MTSAELCPERISRGLFITLLNVSLEQMCKVSVTQDFAYSH